MPWKKRILYTGVILLATVLVACKDCEDCVQDSCGNTIPCPQCASKCDGNDLSGNPSSSSSSSCATGVVDENGNCVFGCGEAQLDCGEGAFCCTPLGGTSDDAFCWTQENQQSVPPGTSGSTGCPNGPYTPSSSFSDGGANAAGPAGPAGPTGPTGSSAGSQGTSSQSSASSAGSAGSSGSSGSQGSTGSSSSAASSTSSQTTSSSSSETSSSVTSSSSSSQTSSETSTSLSSASSSSSSWGDVVGDTGGGSSSSSSSSSSSTDSSTSVGGWSSESSVGACCVEGVGCWTAEEAARLGIVCNVVVNPVCGDGILQAGEECDTGTQNGQLGSLCASDCRSVILACFEPNCGCFTTDQAAVDVIGQLGDTGEFVPSFGEYEASAATFFGFNAPADIAIDTKHHLAFVTDTSNNRVVVYELTANNEFGDKRADFVLGQQNLNTNTPGVSNANMNGPTALALDMAGNRLFVADTGNNRVLVYLNVSSSRFAQNRNADRVIGQNDLNADSAGSVSAGTLEEPRGIAYSSRGYLFVSDTVRNRVLRFDVRNGISNGMNADAVLGQPDFASTTQGFQTIDLNRPRGLLVDGDYLYVADTGNNRVLLFKQNAVKKPSDFEADDPVGRNNALQNFLYYDAPDLNLRAPQHIAANGQYVFVSDSLNNRILSYKKVIPNPSDENALPVLQNPEATLGVRGFRTSLSTFPPNATAARYPLGLAAVPGQCSLYAVDSGNHRILQYKSNGSCTPSFGDQGADQQDPLTTGSYECNLNGVCDTNENCMCEDCGCGSGAWCTRAFNPPQCAMVGDIFSSSSQVSQQSSTTSSASTSSVSSVASSASSSSTPTCDDSMSTVSGEDDC